MVRSGVGMFRLSVCLSLGWSRRGAAERQDWWRGSGVLDQLPQVLRGRGQQDLIACAGEAPEAEAVELEDALEVSERHLDLLALSA